MTSTRWGVKIGDHWFVGEDDKQIVFTRDPDEAHRFASSTLAAAKAHELSRTMSVSTFQVSVAPLR